MKCGWPPTDDLKSRLLSSSRTFNCSGSEDFCELPYIVDQSMVVGVMPTVKVMKTRFSFTVSKILSTRKYLLERPIDNGWFASWWEKAKFYSIYCVVVKFCARGRSYWSCFWADFAVSSFISRKMLSKTAFGAVERRPRNISASCGGGWFSQAGDDEENAGRSLARPTKQTTISVVQKRRKAADQSKNKRWQVNVDTIESSSS